ncbi:protein sorting system archaetidylserine synthase [Haloprofundus halobius]|uniref:protein sorting system archaetidylserine synthase n=1 Tax=Haloprofundus halobius TaxID=2876194 RepID=UPI001CCAC2C9|nr:protein sorting system archaetidylserine synthase [Haloprofundus halobius]
MHPRFVVGRLGVADVVTVGNAGLGFLAVAAANVSPGLAARLILLAAIADGLDGVLARRYGGTDAGPYLDSLADVASFGVAPAMVVVAAVRAVWGFGSLRVAVAVAVAALFVVMAVTRLGMYTAYDADSDQTRGVPTTLAATILAAGVLVGFTDPFPLVGLTALLAALMVTTIPYPDLHTQDALVMGVVQALAILFPHRVGGGFAFGLLFLALAYLFLAPRFYWGR